MTLIDRIVRAVEGQPMTKTELAEHLGVPEYEVRAALTAEVFRYDKVAKRYDGRITVRKGDERYVLGDPTPLVKVER